MLRHLDGHIPQLGDGAVRVPETASAHSAGTVIRTVGDLQISVLHQAPCAGIQRPPDAAAVDFCPAMGSGDPHGKAADEPSSHAGEPAQHQKNMGKVLGVTRTGCKGFGGSLMLGLHHRRQQLMGQLAQDLSSGPGVLRQSRIRNQFTKRGGGLGQSGGIEVQPIQGIVGEIF